MGCLLLHGFDAGDLTLVVRDDALGRLDVGDVVAWNCWDCGDMQMNKPTQQVFVPDGHSMRDHAVAGVKAALNLLPVGGAIASLIDDYVPTS